MSPLLIGFLVVMGAMILVSKIGGEGGGTRTSVGCLLGVAFVICIIGLIASLMRAFG